MDRIRFPWLRVLTSVCLGAFTLLLQLDLRSAFHNQATWIPDKALVLGVFTIQLLTFVAGTNMSLLQDLVNHEKQEHLYLGSAFIAGITVRRILVQMISATILTDKDEEVQPYRETDEIRTWNAFEDELFKLWMVARVSQPDYIIARSILTSTAWLTLSFWVLLYILEFALLLSLLVYMVEQWIVICCRCYSSLLIRKACFSFEDLWTRDLREIINKYDLQYKWRTASSNYSLEISLKRIAALVRLHKLLYLVWVLPIMVVLVCKILSVLPNFVFGKILRQCRRGA